MQKKDDLLKYNINSNSKRKKKKKFSLIYINENNFFFFFKINSLKAKRLRWLIDIIFIKNIGTFILLDNFQKNDFKKINKSVENKF
jgi:hypothetical protein